MKEKIYRWLRKCFFRFGRFIEIRRFPCPEEVWITLNHKNREVHLHELQRICKAIKEVNAQDYYERLLKTYLPQWDKEINDAQFIGEGHSDQGLNVYRKVRLSGKSLFEKVYDTHSLAVNRLFWLEKNIYPYFENKREIPRIKDSFKGELLTIVYFDFLEIPERNKDTEKEALEIARHFYNQSLNLEFLQIFNSAPSYLVDFRGHGKYKAWIKLAEEDLKRNGISTENIEKKLSLGQQVFTHGDIKPAHLSSANGLIDWDESGLYPAGFEQSYLYLSYQMNENKEGEKPLTWLKDHFESMVQQKEWESFKLGFLYFLFIFAQKAFKKGNYLELRTQLIKNLKKYA